MSVKTKEIKRLSHTKNVMEGVELLKHTKNMKLTDWISTAEDWEIGEDLSRRPSDRVVIVTLPIEEAKLWRLR